ncbi:MAG: ATP-binding cassette domain-containing protein [Peptoanaerobacter stomatis]|uniref:ATP-binding cassette domain-containing protein n=1 Tax=Peptoanaerobacter stomatis TaxID=796937 RepID=UPI003F9F62CD
MILKTVKKAVELVYNFSKKLFFLNILITIVAGMSGYLIILSNKILLNNIQIYLNGNDKKLLFDGLVYFALLNLFTVAVRFIKQYYLSKQRVIIQNKLDYMAIKKNGEFQLEDFENSEIYGLIQAGNELGKDKILEIYIDFTKILEMLISIVMGSYMMVRLSPDWWIIAVFLFPCIKLFIDIYVGKINYNKEKKQIEPYRRISYFNYLTSNDIAKKEIITYNFFGYWFDEFKKIKSALQKQDIDVLKKTSFMVFFINIIETILYVFIIGVVVLKRITMTLIGNVFAYIDAIMMIQNNTTELLSYFSDVYKNSLYVDNFFDFIEKETYKNVGVNKVNEFENIHIKNIVYRYPNDYFELKVSDIIINKGKPVVILGKNGSGKTTLLKILSNLYHNFDGEITINGTLSLKNIDKNNYCQKVSVLFQDFNKYEATLKENIAMSETNDYDKEKMIKYVKKVKLDKIVGKLDKGIDTVVGNWFGNTTFSGGQWQRIAIARCLFREAEFLILDEPNSALDKKFEKEFFGILKQILSNKICVMVLHKLTPEIIQLNPQIVILENGLIKAKGDISSIDGNVLNDFIE